MIKSIHTEKSPEGIAYYAPVMIGPNTIAQASSQPVAVRAVQSVVDRLEPDDYTRYLQGFYAGGLERFGEDWQYADICTVLLTASKLLAPERYLEIGVRRGRSMAMVVSQQPTIDVVGFDMWVPDYAGMSNPGPDFVQAEMKRLGHSGTLELIAGNSHETVPRYFSEHPDTTFDIVTVDGDHSDRGALEDLRTVLPRLSVGGLLVFDDVAHPNHPELLDVWRQALQEDRGVRGYEFTEVGYGVAIALRVAPPSTAAQSQPERILERSKQSLEGLRRSILKLDRRWR